MMTCAPLATKENHNSASELTCNLGFGDCDGDATNRCEVNLDTDPTRCRVCAGTGDCVRDARERDAR